MYLFIVMAGVANAGHDLLHRTENRERTPKMQEGIHLSDRARQVARAMLRQRHTNGDYVYLSPAELAEKTGMSKGTVSQIVGRLRMCGWLEDFREEGGGDRVSRFSRDGADEARLVLAEHGTASAPARTQKVLTLAELEAKVNAGQESPAVLAAVRRAMSREKK